MSTRTDLLHGATFHASSPDELPVPELRAVLRERSVIRIRGLFDPAAIRAVKERMGAQFDCANDRKHDPRDTEAVRTNLQKLVVGGITGTNAHRALARFLRMFYNPIFADDIYGMRVHFIRLARLRNRLYGTPPEFAIHGTEDGYWTAARVHQYPRGGGFMVPHTDMYSRCAVADAGCDYAQVFLVMSRKGEDYLDGGAFVELDGQRVYYEDDCEIGDVMVYDGGSVHGVGDVDPLERLDMTSFAGRVVAFVSLYRHLRPGDTDYRELAQKAKRLYGQSEG